MRSFPLVGAPRPFVRASSAHVRLLPACHLVSSDTAIIQVRRRLIGTARALANGKEPEAPWHPEAYAYHSARLVVDADTPVDQAVAVVEALAMQKSGQATLMVR